MADSTSEQAVRYPIADKTVLVTGAARRIGQAVTRELAYLGARVILHYNTSREEVNRVAEAIQMAGGHACAIQADLSQPGQAEALITRAINQAGPIDILINSAAIFPEDRLDTLTPDSLITNININTLSPFLLARAFARQELGDTWRGVVLNFLDARMVDYDREHVSYHLSKRMLFSLTRMMAMEFAPRVRVNAIAPGLILPPEGQDITYLEQLASTNPLNRYGSLEGITDAVVFLVRSTFITGQVIFVDGGRHMRGSMYGE